ncbi:MAG: hypothetical protein ACLTAF_02465 [Blautia coccoides]
MRQDDITLLGAKTISESVRLLKSPSVTGSHFLQDEKKPVTVKCSSGGRDGLLGQSGT